MVDNAKFGGSGITIELYDWIVNNINRGSSILELGSGDASTKYLCEKYTMYSIEDKKEFCNKYRSTYIYAPLKNGWYDIDILKKNIPQKYDLILVDGPTGRDGRMGFFRNLDLFNVEVPIVIDDLVYGDCELLWAVQKATNKKADIFGSKSKGDKTFGILI